MPIARANPARVASPQASVTRVSTSRRRLPAAPCAEAEPISLASAMICVALAYEALNLWELGDELYTRAEELLPLCEDRLLEPVIGINRAQTRFWWTAALLEVGRTGEAVAIAT